MTKLNKSWFNFLVLISVALFWGKANAAAVDVYAKGDLTSTELTINVYALVNQDPIISNGIKLSYDSSKLSVVSATKNEAVWSIGDGINKGNPLPDTSLPGEIVIIGGKLDPTPGATQGVPVSSTPVLLATVVFSRGTDSSLPIADPETYFNLALDFGKPVPFANFVKVKDASTPPETIILDEPVNGGVSFAFSTVSCMKGDFNNNGVVDRLDYTIFASNYNKAYIPADFNNSGKVDRLDWATFATNYNKSCL